MKASTLVGGRATHLNNILIGSFPQGAKNKKYIIEIAN